MRRRVVYFFRQDCLVCNTTYRDLSVSGVDMQIAKVCIDEHPMLKDKQSVPALFVSETKAMHVGSSAIMEYVRGALIEAQMAQMRNDAAQGRSSQDVEGGGSGSQTQQKGAQLQLQQQQQQQQQQQPTSTTTEPSAEDWAVEGDGQAFSWISGDGSGSGGGSRMGMGIDYNDASMWTAAPAVSPDDVPGRGRNAAGIGAPPTADRMQQAPPDRMQLPSITGSQPHQKHQQSMSIEQMLAVRKLEEGSWLSGNNNNNMGR
jgi:hypothetical protein